MSRPITKEQIQDILKKHKVPALKIGEQKKYSKIGKIYWGFMCYWHWFLIRYKLKKFIKKWEKGENEKW